MHCPKCGSTSVIDRRLEVPGGHEMSHAIHAARHLGHPMLAAFGAIGWIGAQIVNHVRDDYGCNSCGHTWNEAN